MSKKEEFISLIGQHQGLINKVTYLYADVHEDRKDLQQEIIGQSWSSFKSYRGEAKFSTWLYRVALNTAISSLKQAKRQEQVRENILVGEGTQTSNEGELLEAILTALNSIEKSIVLLLIEGYAQREIADILGITDGNVRIKVHRIRKKLEKYGVKDFA